MQMLQKLVQTAYRFTRSRYDFCQQAAGRVRGAKKAGKHLAESGVLSALNSLRVPLMACCMNSTAMSMPNSSPESRVKRSV